MVTEKLLAVLAGVFTTIIGWFPDVQLSGSFTGTGPGTLKATITEGLGHIWAFDAWIPVAGVFMLAAAILVAVTAQWTVKLARVVLSLFTAGGGSAA